MHRWLDPCSLERGDMKVELVQPERGDAGPHADFLAETGGGFHQLAWWTEDFHRVAGSANHAGWTSIWSGGDDGPLRRAYYGCQARQVLELSEVTPEMPGMFELVQAAGANWDVRTGSLPSTTCRSNAAGFAYSVR
jgi:Glyoxalase/Bleomycin resistance protein/Dioxygenase superfamily